MKIRSTACPTCWHEQRSVGRVWCVHRSVLEARMRGGVHVIITSTSRAQAEATLRRVAVAWGAHRELTHVGVGGVE